MLHRIQKNKKANKLNKMHDNIYKKLTNQIINLSLFLQCCTFSMNIYDFYIYLVNIVSVMNVMNQKHGGKVIYHCIVMLILPSLHYNVIIIK